jgi:hypothetical protein
MTAPSTTLAECLDRALADAALFGPEGACPAIGEPGAHPRLLVVSGSNAGGKSLFCRYLDQTLAKGGCEVMRVGMGKRTESGMVRAMMFGDEGSESTGNVSVNVVMTGVSTARGRTSDHVLILDEPDVGLSEGYQAALGEFLAAFAADLPERTLGLVVVSHARSLVAPLLAAGASSVRVGDDLRPVAEWLREGDPRRTVAELEALSGLAHARSTAVQAVLNARRAANKT